MSELWLDVKDKDKKRKAAPLGTAFDIEGVYAERDSVALFKLLPT